MEWEGLREGVGGGAGDRRDVGRDRGGSGQWII